VLAEVRTGARELRGTSGVADLDRHTPVSGNGFSRGFLDHALMIRSRETARASPGAGDLGHGRQVGAGAHDPVAGGAGGTIMDMPMSRSWPGKTRWNQCSSTPSDA
jgi:hypothetical protein